MNGQNSSLVIEEIPAVAGHVDVYVEGKETVVRVKFSVTQDPRFFERFLKGRPSVEVPYVMSRICGVCSIVHLTCSIDAIEKALGVEPSEEILKLRKLAKGLEVIQNNLVHVLMSLPDFTGCNDVVSFSKGYQNIFNKLMNTNRLALEAYKRICGRFVHTPTLGVAAHSKPVSKYELESAGKLLHTVAKELEEMVSDLAEIWRPLAEGFSDPAPTYCVLNSDEEYPLFSPSLLFSDGVTVPVEKYSTVIEELRSPYSNAHYTLYRNGAFYSGSRARIQAYSKIIGSEISAITKMLSIDPSNPFDNVKAQYIEVVYLSSFLGDLAFDLAEEFRGGISPSHVAYSSGSGEGVAAATAPRGVLIHHYIVKGGKLESANIITPTVINARHMEVAGEALVRRLVECGESEKSIKSMVAALVRAYDPCLPCAVH
ncbi:MAG: nickel-dependent hydrogenase large subunit [Thermofilaceae archaeon]